MSLTACEGLPVHGTPNASTVRFVKLKGSTRNH